MGAIQSSSYFSDNISESSFYFNDKYEKKLWYLDGATSSPLSVDIYSVWKDYNGAGVKVAVIDSQIDFRHSELSKAYSTKLDYNFSLNTSNIAIDPNNLPHFHGTAVAGVIAAEAGNSCGTVGLASGATLVGLGINYSDSDVVSQIVSALYKAAESDVVNNSWSFSSNFGDNFAKQQEYEAALTHAVSEGRNGLGASVVFAAGNAGVSGTSNYHNFQNSPYSIAVGAVDPTGGASSFTSLGANVLISAAGRDVYTTTVNERYDSVSGTSFAAPAVSAAIALMLEANADLGYRDVQEILAYSARREGLGDGANFGDGWRTNGATNANGGGLHFSDAFGYGFLNVHDAVRLAETWTEQKTFSNLTTASQTFDLNKELVAGSADHLTFTLHFDKDIDIEHAQLSLDMRWLNTGDLDIYLTSPDGTQVRLVYDLPYEDRVGSIRNFAFGSVASMGEHSAGNWTIDVINRDPGATDKTGAAMTTMIQSATLTVSGDGHASANDTYIYTDEFGSLYTGADAKARSTLKDTDGGTDTINAAAVTSGSIIDLSGKTASQIAGVKLSLSAPNIENAFTGDGNDVLIGNTSNNHLSAGRGDDTLYFSFGHDVLDGGQGMDSVIFNCAFSALTGHADAGSIILSMGTDATSSICNVEQFVFSDHIYSYGELEALFAGTVSSELPDHTETGIPRAEQPAETPDAPSAGDDTHLPDAPPPADNPAQRTYDQTMAGTSGIDKLSGSAGNDWIEGHAGDDKLYGNSGDDALSGDEGDDLIAGGEGSDILHGGAGQDNLSGDAGDDWLFGGADNDLLKGGEGNDWIEGGAGQDRLFGDAGADTFVFNVADFDTPDFIYDFDAAQGDRIKIVGLSAQSNATFEFEQRGTSTYLEMHIGDISIDIARIKGTGMSDLNMSVADDGLIWA